MEDEIKVNGKRSQTVEINEINSSHSHSIRIQFVCLILFIILFLITLSALIAIIFIFGLQNPYKINTSEQANSSHTSGHLKYNTFCNQSNIQSNDTTESTVPVTSVSSIIITTTTTTTTTTTITTTTLLTAQSSTANPESICNANATLIDSKCVCNMGFAGDGQRYCDECGLTFNSQNSRIVGGIEAVPHSWPSVAYILFRYKGDVYIPELKLTALVRQSFRCMGTLIDRNTIITAAHCITRKLSFSMADLSFEFDVKPSKYNPTVESMYKVYLGMHNRSVINSYDISPAERYSVSKIIIHKDYDDIYKLNDIAILKLVREVELNEYIQISCLPFNNPYPKENVQAFAVGWGSLNYSGESPSTLYNVRITVYNNSMCRRVAFEVDKNWNSQICAGEYEGGKDTCQGDSGGSLFTEEVLNEKKKFISAGIVSYGMGCAEKYYPGIYTRVSYYLDWIRKYSS